MDDSIFECCTSVKDENMVKSPRYKRDISKETEGGVQLYEDVCNARNNQKKLISVPYNQKVVMAGNYVLLFEEKPTKWKFHTKLLSLLKSAVKSTKNFIQVKLLSRKKK